ncbi:hypothetical protein [Streptomyces sp. NPDC047028]|uniref:hypothetical protein n=1 Tax=Streptomyces sp. NPDC047028 TaxID=3155793 RepID=UPI0033EA61C9
MEQGVELVVIKEFLEHAHIGVTATVFAHVLLRLQRQAIYLLGLTLGTLPETPGDLDDGDETLPLPTPCPLTLPSNTAVRHSRGPTGKKSVGAADAITEGC